MKGYSLKEIPEKSATARGVDLNISMKDSVNIAHHLRGMSLKQARETIERGIKKEKAIPYFRYLDSVSHRKGSGPGRYPVRALKAFDQVLDNAEANAEFKNLDTENLVIVHIAATKGRMVKKYLPKAHGRAAPWFKDLINVEIVLEEVSE